MADDALLRKLNVKPGTRIELWNPPNPLLDRLTADRALPSSVLLIFAYSIADLERDLPTAVDQLNGRLLWAAFPKKTSSITTDISRDNGWDILPTLCCRFVNLIAIDNDWSAFRLHVGDAKPNLGPRPPAGPRPDLVLPPELAERLEASPESRAYFETLSYTCKREYIEWITTAKREETKLKRLDAAIEKLEQHIKSPLR